VPAAGQLDKDKTKGIGDHERVSIPLSRENYNFVEAIAKRKAMPLSSFCAGLLDEKITELRKQQA
jgi:hypothetical protein